MQKSLPPYCETCNAHHLPESTCLPHEAREKGRCIDHHFACDCREADYRTVAAALLQAHSAKTGKRCDCSACRIASALFPSAEVKTMLDRRPQGVLASFDAEKFSLRELVVDTLWIRAEYGRLSTDVLDLGEFPPETAREILDLEDIVAQIDAGGEVFLPYAGPAPFEKRLHAPHGPYRLLEDLYGDFEPEDIVGVTCEKQDGQYRFNAVLCQQTQTGAAITSQPEVTMLFSKNILRYLQEFAKR